MNPVAFHDASLSLEHHEILKDSGNSKKKPPPKKKRYRLLSFSNALKLRVWIPSHFPHTAAFSSFAAKSSLGLTSFSLLLVFGQYSVRIDFA